MLKDLFGFPGRSARTGGDAPTKGVHPSAVEAPGARNADLPGGWSLSTTPSPKPHVPQSAGVRAPRGPWASLGGPLEWLWCLQFVKTVQPLRKVILAFWSPPPDILEGDSVAASNAEIAFLGGWYKLETP